jgi:hypothetical protein
VRGLRGGVEHERRGGSNRGQWGGRARGQRCGGQHGRRRARAAARRARQPGGERGRCCGARGAAASAGSGAAARAGAVRRRVQTAASAACRSHPRCSQSSSWSRSSGICVGARAKDPWTVKQGQVQTSAGRGKQVLRRATRSHRRGREANARWAACDGQGRAYLLNGLYDRGSCLESELKLRETRRLGLT